MLLLGNKKAPKSYRAPRRGEILTEAAEMGFTWDSPVHGHLSVEKFSRKQLLQDFLSVFPLQRNKHIMMLKAETRGTESSRGEGVRPIIGDFTALSLALGSKRQCWRGKLALHAVTSSVTQVPSPALHHRSPQHKPE